MKNLFLALITVAALVSCSKSEDPTVIDSSMPQGDFTISKSGSFVEENSTGSAGTAEIGMDTESTTFLHFKSDFTTNLGTGTVTVFFSTTKDDLKTVFDPASGNKDVELVGIVNQNGDQYFKLKSAVDSKFQYVVLWCASAGIPFGYAELK